LNSQRRVKLHPPNALLERLNKRLNTLTGGARGLPERQQTLRSAIVWSYDLLSENEQRLFARLGVFVGGWSLEATEAVCMPTYPRCVRRARGIAQQKPRTADRECKWRTALHDVETIREYALKSWRKAARKKRFGGHMLTTIWR
jgi:non-specific serine/threonine protein kinase